MTGIFEVLSYTAQGTSSPKWSNAVDQRAYNDALLHKALLDIAGALTISWWAKNTHSTLWHVMSDLPSSDNTSS